MKKVNNVVSGFLIGVLALASVFSVSPSMVFAADNENISLSGVDARAILTNGGINHVSDFNSTDVLTVSFPATSSSNSLNGDGAYGLSLSGSNLFAAAGKYDLAGTSGGLQVFDVGDLSTALSLYGTDTFTYSKVFVVGTTAFVAFLDASYAPFLGAVSYANPAAPVGLDTEALNPATSTGDITAITVSGGYAYVGIQDDGSGANGGYINIVNISNPTLLIREGTYPISDAVTSLAVNGNTLYAGHGNKISIFNVTSPGNPAFMSDISTGAQVNGLTTDGTYLYVATGNGLKVYALANLSLVGEYNTAMNATAVSVDGGFIYVATSDGSDSEIVKIKMVVITLTGANPQTIQLGAGYTELGATVTGGATIVIDSSAFADTIGSYDIIYTANDSAGTPGLQITRTVNVIDAIGPVITLTGPNPQTVQLGASCYTELGATTNDGSLVQIDSSAVNCLAAGSYTVTYNALDGSGNAAVQKTRTVNVVTTAWTITASTSGAGTGTINPTGAVVIANGTSQAFTMTPTPGSIVSDVLVDGVSVGAVYSYTFNNVIANHTIVANFELGTYYTITASANPNGSISPSGSIFVNSGNSQSFTITPNSGYRIANVAVDGASVGTVTSYSFTNVTANHDIVANFARNSGGGGSGGGSSGGSGGNGNPTFWEIPGCGMRTTGYSTVSGISCVNNIPHNEGEVLGAEKFIFTLFLKRTSPPPYPTTPAAYINEIMELQKFLNAHGYESGPVDGKFGPITEGAVKRFQAANGLVADGIVGPLTRAVLNR